MKRLCVAMVLAVAAVGCGSSDLQSEIRGATVEREADAGQYVDDISEYADDLAPFLADIAAAMDRSIAAADTGDMDYARDVCAELSESVEALWYEMPPSPDRTLGALVDSAIIDLLISYDECATGDFGSAADSMSRSAESWDAATERVEDLRAEATR